MGNLGTILIIGVVIASMAAAFYAYNEQQTNYVTGVAGQTVRVGPTEYVVTFEGTGNGDKDIRPEDTFLKIGIVAENISSESTNLSGGQFLLHDGTKNHQAVYGGFSETDLLFEEIEPGKPVQRTTQFDIPFDEDRQYDVIIRPQKVQSTIDTATICLTRCS